MLRVARELHEVISSRYDEVVVAAAAAVVVIVVASVVAVIPIRVSVGLHLDHEVG